MVIRPLQPDEASVLRDVRLRALDDAPEAFGLTRFEAAALPMEHWRRMTRAHTEPGGGVIFVVDGGAGQTNATGEVQSPREASTVTGMIAVRRDRFETGRAHIGQFWVAPEWRRVGLGVALLTATVYWAKRQRITELLTWVEKDGQVGHIFERAGFVYTGKGFPQPGAPFITLCELRYEPFQPEENEASAPSSPETNDTLPRAPSPDSTNKAGSEAEPVLSMAA